MTQKAYDILVQSSRLQAEAMALLKREHDAIENAGGAPYELTAFDIAKRFVGAEEIDGEKDNPLIMAMLQLDVKWPDHDEVPWCSAFVNAVAWILDLPRSKSLRARSWLLVGQPVSEEDAKVGFDVVVMSRGSWRPGPEVIKAPGHVGFFGGWSRDGKLVRVLGGNQSNRVSIEEYGLDRILGIRRLL